MQHSLEKCTWIDWKQGIPGNICESRVYFGHETCEKLLPDFKDISQMIQDAQNTALKLTFVTPFLSETGIEKVIVFLNQLNDATSTFEVVISDWGLLDWICDHPIGIPVISRFMAGQQLDFRLSALLANDQATDKIISIDGIVYRLKQKPLPSELAGHIKSCSLLTQGMLEYFNKMGIFRFEISNVFHDLNLSDCRGNSYSLHVPLVPLAVMRQCPGKDEDFNTIGTDCQDEHCDEKLTKWHLKNSNFDIGRLGNCVYYLNEEWESKVMENTGIDRVVFRNIGPFN